MRPEGQRKHNGSEHCSVFIQSGGDYHLQRRAQRHFFWNRTISRAKDCRTLLPLEAALFVFLTSNGDSHDKSSAWRQLSVCKPGPTRV